MSKICKRLILDNDIEQISLLKEYIDSIAEEANIDPSLAMSLNLALEEAVTNVVLYAYPVGTAGKAFIDATVDQGAITFVISDTGVAFDPTKEEDADVTLAAEDRPIGGLGIFLVRQLMDSVEYQRLDGYNMLTIKKILDKE